MQVWDSENKVVYFNINIKDNNFDSYCTTQIDIYDYCIHYCDFMRF